MIKVEAVFRAVDKISKPIMDMAKSGKHAGKSLDASFGSISGAISTAQNLLIGGAIATGIGKIVGAAMDLETAKTEFEVLTGSMQSAEKVVSDLRKKGAETPFEFGDLANVTKTMMQFGATADEATASLDLLGNIAMGDKNKLNGLGIVFGQVRSAGKLTGQDLMQMINQGFNPLVEISKKTGRSMASLRDDMSKGKISFDMVKEAMVQATSKGGMFYQGMEKGAKTAAGKISTLKDNFNSVLVAIGEKALPIVIKLIDRLTEIAVRTEAWIEQNKELIGMGIDIFFGTLGIAVEAIVLLFESGLVPVIIGAIVAYKGLILVTKGAAAVQTMFRAATLASAKAGGILNAVIAANPIMLLVIAIAAVIAIIVLLVKHWDWIIEKLIAVYHWFDELSGVVKVFGAIALAAFLPVLAPIIAVIAAVYALYKAYKWVKGEMDGNPINVGMTENPMPGVNMGGAGGNGNVGFGGVPMSPNAGLISSKSVEEKKQSVDITVKTDGKADVSVASSGDTLPGVKLPRGKGF